MADGPEKASPEPKKPRTPQPGSALEFRGWTSEETGLAAFAAHVVGEKVTLTYLTRNGSWLVSHMTPYDASGETPGSWRWPKR